MKNRMPPHVRAKLRQRWCFQPDNDPKHTSKAAKNCFTPNKVRVLDWPSQILDLNPVKNFSINFRFQTEPVEYFSDCK